MNLFAEGDLGIWFLWSMAFTPRFEPQCGFDQQSHSLHGSAEGFGYAGASLAI